MITKIAPVIRKIIVTLGAVFAGLFLYLSLMGEDMEPNSDTKSNPPLPVDDTYKGTINDEQADPDSIASAVTIDNKLYVLWTRDGVAHYSTFSGTSWANKSDLEGLGDGPIKSNYGIDNILFKSMGTHDTTTPMFCMFTKNGSIDDGVVEYSCADQTEYVKHLPTTTYFDPFSTDMELTHVTSLISTERSFVETGKFFVAASQYDTVDKEYYVRDIACNITGTSLNGNCYLANTRLIGKDPSVLIIPTAQDETGTITQEMRYLFYRGNNNDIFYQSDKMQSPIALENHNKERRATQRRPAVYLFKDNVYVVWKNEDKEGIRFAKISAEDLTDTSNGFQKWGYCQMDKNDGDFILKTTGTPNLFEYHDQSTNQEALYILYPNSGQSNKLTYYRIDNTDLNSDKCKKQDDDHTGGGA